MQDKDWKVLLIDDDPGILTILSIAVEDVGCQVLMASDGQTGIALRESESPQIVVTDLNMPGVTGLDVLRHIKSRDVDTEVIVITGYGDTAAAIQALQNDASDFILKPISTEAFQVALKRARERYVTRRELRDYTAILEEKWMATAEELARTFNLQCMLIEGSIDGIVACDCDDKVVVFNKAMEEILGISRRDAIGATRLDELFLPGEEAKFRARFGSDAYGGRNRLFLDETVLVGAGGARIPCQVSAALLMQGTEEAGIVCFFRDLREMRRLAQQVEDQARLLHQDKMISLGKLAASVVHEINNPIAGVLNYARLMQKIVERGEIPKDRVGKFQGYLNLMESELSRCSKIISNLLAFSRKSRLEFGDVNLNELLSRCITLSEHRLTLQNIRIESRLDPALPSVTGDFNQLQQCVINLIFNAIDSMPDGGTLGVESGPGAAPDVVEMRVWDTGCGISEDDLPYIFDPFFTTKTEGKGLGLGLSTVYGIVDRHKGTIHVKSDFGKGTRFTIALPACRAAK